jgi:hypothetical protein
MGPLPPVAEPEAVIVVNLEYEKEVYRMPPTYPCCPGPLLRLLAAPSPIPKPAK